MTYRLQFFQWNHVPFVERAAGGPAKRVDVAEAAEQTTHVPRERTYIGALAAFGLEHGAVFIWLFYKG